MTVEEPIAMGFGMVWPPGSGSPAWLPGWLAFPALLRSRGACVLVRTSHGGMLAGILWVTVTLHVPSPGAQQNPQQQPLITEDFSNLEPPLGGWEEARMSSVVAILHTEWDYKES